jgi:hypothetical protein
MNLLFRFLAAFVFLLFVSGANSFAQTGIKGHIRDEKGAGLSFANIFVKELANGTSSNEDGYYEFKMPPGNYTVVFQYLGYKTVEKPVTLSTEFALLDVKLESQSVVLKEVIVRDRKEDPAYSIMRKAIAKSEYHQKQVQAYQARVYVKGAGQILKMPGMIKKQIEKDEGEKIDLDRVYLTESISELSFQMPDKYKERIISVKSSGNDGGVNPTEFIKSSLYQPVIADIVSPLSPRAFSYYRFSLEGTFRDQNREINKIKVTPFSRGEDVFEGFIYIIDDLWCLYSAELSVKKLGFELVFDETFSAVLSNVWMPTAFKFNIKGGVLGFNVEYKYFASLSNYKIELNPNLPKDVNLIDEKLVKVKKNELPKDFDDLEKLMSEGKEIRRKDMTKFMKNMEEEENKRLLAEKKAKKEALKNQSKQTTKSTSSDTIKVAPQYTGTIVEIDSTARNKSEEFWNEFRPVPLTVKEIDSYRIGDSIRVVKAEESRKKDSLAAVNPDASEKKNSGSNPFKYLNYVLMGNTFTLGKGMRVEILPLLRDASYNAVEGWVLTSGLVFSKKFVKKDSLIVQYASGKTTKRAKEIFDMSFSPLIRYSFARETAIGRGDLAFNFRRSKFVNEKDAVELSAGRYVFQLNEQNPISTVVNTFYAYTLGRNFMKLYEKDFLKLSIKNHWHKTFSTQIFAELSERTMLENNSNKTLGKGKDFAFEPNVPFNAENDSVGFGRHNAFIIGISGVWKPRKGGLSRESSDLPEIKFDYRKALPSIGGGDADFDLVQVGLKHEIEIGIKRYFGFSLGAGAFLNKNKVFFPDYAHFLGNRTILQTHDRYASFRILDYYENSTADKFFRAHVHYQFRKFLLTQITPIRFMGWKERIFANVLQTPTTGNYLEVGFGIDNIFRFFSLEGITSFQNGNFKDWGIRVGISNLKNMSIFN